MSDLGINKVVSVPSSDAHHCLPGRPARLWQYCIHEGAEKQSVWSCASIVAETMVTS